MQCNIRNANYIYILFCSNIDDSMYVYICIVFQYASAGVCEYAMSYEREQWKHPHHPHHLHHLRIY